MRRFDNIVFICDKNDFTKCISFLIDDGYSKISHLDYYTASIKNGEFNRESYLVFITDGKINLWENNPWGLNFFSTRVSKYQKTTIKNFRIFNRKHKLKRICLE